MTEQPFPKTGLIDSFWHSKRSRLRNGKMNPNMFKFMATIKWVQRLYLMITVLKVKGFHFNLLKKHFLKIYLVYQKIANKHQKLKFKYE